MNLESDNSSLCPLSYWRLSYIRETQLWNNWRRGNYKETSLPSNFQGYSDSSFFDEQFDKTLFFKDDFVVRACEGYLHVYVFDDKNELCCVYSVEFPINPKYGVQLLASGDKLLLVEDLNVSVFKLNVSPLSKLLHLTYKFQFQELQFCQQEVFRHVVFPNFNMENKFILDGVIFVAVCKTKVGEKICIWNLETMAIVKEECLPEDNIKYQWIDIYHIDKETKNLLVGYSTKRHQDERRRDPYIEEVHFKIYNLIRKAFLPFKFSILRMNMGYFISSSCAIYDQFCAFIFVNNIRVYNFVTNVLVYEGPAATNLVYEGPSATNLTCFQKGFLYGMTNNVLNVLEVPSLTEKHYNCEFNLQNNWSLERRHFIACNQFLVEYTLEEVRTKKPVIAVNQLLDVRGHRTVGLRKDRLLMAKRTDSRVDNRVSNKNLDVKQSLILYHLNGYKPLECNTMGTRLILGKQAKKKLIVLTFW